jgi:hypothetical protein
MKSARRGNGIWSRLIVTATLLSHSARGGDSPNPQDLSPAPVNCSIQVTILRCSGKKGIAQALLRDCRQPSEVSEALRKAASVNLVYHSTRNVTCDEARGAVDFVALESRPVVYLGGPGATNISRAYGTELHLRIYNAAPAGSPGLFVIDWDGAWSGSPQLMARWESLAVRGFNAASKIPGIAYQKTEEDEDGFVNTGSGSDISGLFKKKPKDKPAAAADSKSTAPAEPDYMDDPGYEQIPLQGQQVIAPGGMIVARQPLKGTDGVEELFLIISL